MIELVRQLSTLFDRRERLKLLALSIALLVRAFVEMVGVGSIAPFMSIVADPTIIDQTAWLKRAYIHFGFDSTNSFLIAVGIVVVAMLAVTNSLSAAATWAMLRFSWSTHHRISDRLFRGYLAQPYSVFVERNSAAFNKTILTEVQSVINGVLTPALNIVSRSLVVAALLILLVVLDPKLAVVIILLLGGGYGSLYMLVKSTQRRLGIERLAANEQRYKIVSEAFGGIKEVKVLQRESSFAERFTPESWTFSRAVASNVAVAQLPRYLFETIAFGGIVLIVLYYLRAGYGVSHILPTISLYAFAGYRLMPELQHLFGAVAQVRFHRAALDDLTSDLRRFGRHTAPIRSSTRPLPFEHGICVRNVTFSYPGSARPALADLSICIPKNATVGLVGASGSGKTTLVDLLLGLYSPDSGCILVDATPLDGTTRTAWLPRVGYVPQHIFLSDDTIANNIAFGATEDDVDFDRVVQAARIAHIDDFIARLPDGYGTTVGERGVRLSGGQRQRIGIARALYRDPDVLILDEATSALDGVTEEGVMAAIRELSGRKTIVLIAHRLSTVVHCDRLFVLDKGRLAAEGTYDELIRRSRAFREMARVQLVQDK